MKKFKLAELFDMQMGKTPARNKSDYWNGGTNPWISIADMSLNGKYITTTKETITDKAVDETGIKPIYPGTVIMSFKLSVGKVARTTVKSYSNEAIMAFEIKDVEPSQYTIDNEYAYYLLSSLNFDNIGNKAVMGKTLNKAILQDTTVCVHRWDEQRKIIAKLDKVNELIDLRKQQLSKLDELVKARFVELFGDPIANTKHWSTELLESVTIKIGSGATPKGGKESYQSEGITLIRSMNVHDGRFEYKDLAHITDEQAKQLDNVTVVENDVFINITGASVARSCIVPKHILPARVNQHVSIIRCRQNIFNPIFANNLFLNQSFKKLLLETGESGGATRQAITKQQLEKLSVIIPPIELQNEFADFVKQTEKSKLSIQQSLEKLETLKKSLMQQYFG